MKTKIDKDIDDLGTIFDNLNEKIEFLHFFINSKNGSLILGNNCGQESIDIVSKVFAEYLKSGEQDENLDTFRFNIYALFFGIIQNESMDFIDEFKTAINELHRLKSND
jgi:hypothetical protein